LEEKLLNVGKEIDNDGIRVVQGWFCMKTRERNYLIRKRKMFEKET
jgi:hypothetical protein